MLDCFSVDCLAKGVQIDIALLGFRLVDCKNSLFGMSSSSSVWEGVVVSLLMGLDLGNHPSHSPVLLAAFTLELVYRLGAKLWVDGRSSGCHPSLRVPTAHEQVIINEVLP